MPPYGGGSAMPPPPGGYGMPPGGAPAAGPYSPIDAVKYGWNKFTQNAAPFAIVTVVMLLIAVAINFAANFVLTGSALGTSTDPVTGMPDAGVGAQLASSAASMVTTLVTWVLSLALVRGAIDVVDTGRTDLGAMFTRINWGQAIIAAILVGIATTVGLILCILPGIVIGFLLYYTNVAVVDGAPAIEAMKASFEFTKSHLAETLLFALVGIGLTIVGICTCGIGLIVITPVLMIGLVYTWRVLQGRPVAA